MKKNISAIIIAFLMTLCVGAAIFAVGWKALMNQNGAVAANSQAQASEVANVSASQQVQIQQMQNLINQYQDREKQYQQREQQYQQKINQDQTQIQQMQGQFQQMQMLIEALQQRGIITITSDGRVFINH